MLSYIVVSPGTPDVWSCFALMPWCLAFGNAGLVMCEAAGGGSPFVSCV